MVLIEASKFGRPMITCEIGTGTTYINEHNKTGLVVPPNDPQKLAAAIERLSSDENLANRFGKAARQRYESLFTAEKMAASYIHTYNKAASSGKS